MTTRKFPTAKKMQWTNFSKRKKRAECCKAFHSIVELCCTCEMPCFNHEAEKRMMVSNS